MVQSSFFGGIDVGSSFTKTVLIDHEKQICGLSIAYSGTNLLKTAEKVICDALPDRNQFHKIKRLVGTGFGRKSIQFDNLPFHSITEISCAAKAAQLIYPKRKLTIVDIGGQDTKIIKMQNGKRIGFKMNRKCAAGTGSFLEELALKLRVQLDELDKFAQRSLNPIQISSYCTVFAATEILSRIRSGEHLEDMVSGAFHSIVKRVMEIDTLEDEIILTGGVISHNPTIIKIFEQEIGRSVSIPSDPQFFVALGAALYALEKEDFR